MDDMLLRMADGTRIVVPPSLDAITTYVILEQEKWFEKEATFVASWLQPGMTVIDIGANLGVYSLPHRTTGWSQWPGFQLRARERDAPPARNQQDKECGRQFAYHRSRISPTASATRPSGAEIHQAS